MSSSSSSSSSDEDVAGAVQQSPRAALDMPAQQLGQQVAEQPDDAGAEQQSPREMAAGDMPAQQDQQQAAEQQFPGEMAGGDMPAQPPEQQAAEEPEAEEQEQPEQAPFDAEAGGDASAPIFFEEEEDDNMRPYMEGLIDVELDDIGFSARQREAAGDAGLNVVADGAGPAGAAAPLNLTPNDELAIARLTALGFNYSVAAQVYISVGRNETLARNFLYAAANADNDSDDLDEADVD